MYSENIISSKYDIALSYYLKTCPIQLSSSEKHLYFLNSIPKKDYNSEIYLGNINISYYYDGEYVFTFNFHKHVNIHHRVQSIKIIASYNNKVYVSYKYGSRMNNISRVSKFTILDKNIKETVIGNFTGYRDTIYKDKILLLNHNDFTIYNIENDDKEYHEVDQNLIDDIILIDDYILYTYDRRIYMQNVKEYDGESMILDWKSESNYMINEEYLCKFMIIEGEYYFYNKKYKILNMNGVIKIIPVSDDDNKSLKNFSIHNRMDDINNRYIPKFRKIYVYDKFNMYIAPHKIIITYKYNPFLTYTNNKKSISIVKSNYYTMIKRDRQKAIFLYWCFYHVYHKEVIPEEIKLMLVDYAIYLDYEI
jgi:hypothetical protein